MRRGGDLRLLAPRSALVTARGRSSLHLLAHPRSLRGAQPVAPYLCSKLRLPSQIVMAASQHNQAGAGAASRTVASRKAIAIERSQERYVSQRIGKIAGSRL